jgi:hypothetical protein
MELGMELDMVLDMDYMALDNILVYSMALEDMVLGMDCSKDHGPSSSSQLTSLRLRLKLKCFS